jgi:type IV conjugative transfer system protein TraL
MSDPVIRVEQHLQDVPRILLVPVDEGLAALLPVGFGLMTQHLIPGLAMGLLSFALWKRFKGEGGVPHVLALLYWVLPRPMNFCRSLPDSAVSVWRG